MIRNISIKQLMQQASHASEGEQEVKNSAPASRGVNDSWVRRHLVLAVDRLERLSPPCLKRRLTCGGVVLLTPNIVLKKTRRPNLAEARTLSFLAEHTSVPVPKVLCAFQSNGHTYIAMQRMRGDLIQSRWDKLGEDERSSIRMQMRAIMDELRSVPSPMPGRVGNIDFGALSDFRLPRAPCGLFGSSREFFSHLIWGLKDSRGDLDKAKLIEAGEKDYPTCLSHCDLNGSNIFVRDGTISGIIDWEMAGWYPVYWEYVMAWEQLALEKSWRPEADNYLQKYVQEREIEDLRQTVFPAS